jgi:hypothetical protein
MGEYEPPQHPPPVSFWRHIGAGLIYILLGDGCLSSLLFGVLFAACSYLVVGFFVGFSHLESPTDPIGRFAAGLFYILCWLRLVLGELRTQARTGANPLRHRLSKLFSEPLSAFWIGMSFFGVLLVLLAFPAFAGWPSILWVMLGLGLFLPAILRFLLRRFLRLAYQHP